MARRKRNHCLICLEIRTLYLVIVNECVVYLPNPFPIQSALMRCAEIGVEVGTMLIVCLTHLFGIGKNLFGILHETAARTSERKWAPVLGYGFGECLPLLFY